MRRMNAPQSKSRGLSGGAGSFSASNRRRFRSLSSAGRWVSIPGSSTTGENACGKWMRLAQALRSLRPDGCS